MSAFTLRADEELLAEDHFCGAGGVTSGIRGVAGWRVVHAANHDPVCIATHSTNYGDVEHSLADIPTMDPYKGPKAHVLFTAPECRSRSYARGRPKDDPSLFDPAGDATEERSRATMDEVPRFAEARRYVMVVVENVPQLVDWCERKETGHHKKCNCGRTFRRWLRDMTNLGYEHRKLFLNSMLFPPTPQSRDRIYIVFWLRGLPAPNLDHQAIAWCPACERIVEAQQRAKAHLRRPEPVRLAWGPHDTVWGRYGQQYIYACPNCGQRAQPAITPAASAIEWWRDPGPRIGERVERGMRALEQGTIERVARGILRLPHRPLTVPLHRLTDPASRRCRDAELETLGTLTAQHRDALVVAVGGNLSERPGQTRAWPTDQPLRTITATLDRGVAGFTAQVGGQTGASRRERGLDEPLSMVTTDNHRALVIPDVGGNARAGRSTREALPTALTRETTALVMSNQEGNAPKRDDEAMDACTTHNTHALVVSNMNNNVPRDAGGEPAGTVTTGAKLYLAQPDPMVVHARRNTPAATTSGEPIATITAEGNQHWLVVANNGGPASKRSQQGHARDAEHEVLGTQTGGGQHATVTMRGAGQVHHVGEALPTCATVEQHALAEIMPIVEQSTFRMLEPSEIGRGMVMYLTAEGARYVIHGNRRQQVRQLGNAVTPPVAQWIAERIKDALQGA